VKKFPSWFSLALVPAAAVALLFLASPRVSGQSPVCSFTGTVLSCDAPLVIRVANPATGGTTDVATLGPSGITFNAPNDNADIAFRQNNTELPAFFMRGRMLFSCRHTWEGGAGCPGVQGSAGDIIIANNAALRGSATADGGAMSGQNLTLAKVNRFNGPQFGMYKVALGSNQAITVASPVGGLFLVHEWTQGHQAVFMQGNGQGAMVMHYGDGNFWSTVDATPSRIVVTYMPSTGLVQIQNRFPWTALISFGTFGGM